MRWKKIFRRPILDFAGTMGIKPGGIEGRDTTDPAFFCSYPTPEIFATAADAGDWADPGNDSTSSGHRVVISLSCASRYRFMQNSVLVATGPTKKPPMIFSAIGARGA